MDILSLKLEWTFLTRLNIFSLSPFIVPVLALITQVLTLCYQRKKDEKQRRHLRWRIGSNTEHFLGERVLGSRRLFLGPRPGCWAMFSFLWELLPTRRKLMSDLWMLLTFWVTHSWWYSGGKIMLIRGVGQPCGYWAESLVRGHPVPR